MSSRSPSNLYVFRETRERVYAADLLRGLSADIEARRSADALVRAGELEAALADAGAPAAAAAEALTDALASAALGLPSDVTGALDRMTEALGATGQIVVVPPESFSYYGLHPKDFADRVRAPPLDTVTSAAVVGLRSIGTTLSAIVAAALRARGARADRRTVRPSGEPYARSMHLDAGDRAWARDHAGRGSDFLVVDEGPGMSGSTLLSVVDALAGAGVPRDRITVICTREPDPETLLASQGAPRWRALRVAVVHSSPRVPEAFVPLAPGSWRARYIQPGQDWPACWPWLERMKAVSTDGQRLRKFEGLGRYGAEARARALAVADAGFGPAARGAEDGRVEYDVVRGWGSTANALDERVVDRLADYCAWRGAAFPAPAANPAIGDMVRFNSDNALGVVIRVTPRTERAVVTDGHLMPCEWIRSEDGTLLKTDAASHGTDHLFPGPTDIAWDLAGAIVEWRMPEGAMDRLLDRYTRLTGDAPRGRLPEWLLAYALHRLARAELAAAGAGCGDEGDRLAREASGYRGWLRAAAASGFLGVASSALVEAA